MLWCTDRVLGYSAMSNDISLEGIIFPGFLVDVDPGCLGFLDFFPERCGIYVNLAVLFSGCAVGMIFSK